MSERKPLIMPHLDDEQALREIAAWLKASPSTQRIVRLCIMPTNGERIWSLRIQFYLPRTSGPFTMSAPTSRTIAEAWGALKASPGWP